MKWRAPADRRVVEAVIATFRDSPEIAAQLLSELNHRRWARSYYWLDASGMALYLLDRLETLDIESALPAATLDRLRRNRDDNRQRAAALFAEFAAINLAFQQAGIAFANLKGFTLLPDSCPDPALRCQLDLDFLVDAASLPLCREILARTGYAVTAATHNVWECKAGASELARMSDHYKPRPQRSVELHFAPSPNPAGSPGRDARLDRLTPQTWNGVTFPALHPADQFIGQAVHLYGHLRGACTRLAWLLEFQRHIAMRHYDTAFWSEVRDRAQSDPGAPIAIGLASLLSAKLFGGEAPSGITSWTVDRLPSTVRLWADRYGRQAVLADFPGTKLYLFLGEHPSPHQPSSPKERRNRLLPLHRVPRITFPAPGDSAWKRLRNHVHQARFILFRLRFHVVEGLRYRIEANRWKRDLAALHGPAPMPRREEARLTESAPS